MSLCKTLNMLKKLAKLFCWTMILMLWMRPCKKLVTITSGFWPRAVARAVLGLLALSQGDPSFQKSYEIKQNYFASWNMMRYYDNSMKYYEVSWEFNEILWSFVTIQWNIMKYCENSMKYYEVSWQFNEILCSFVTIQWNIMRFLDNSMK